MSSDNNKKKRYIIELYRDRKGKSQVEKFFYELMRQDKNAAVKLYAKLDIITQHGLEFANSRHIEEEIWEFKISQNRILYFIYSQNKIILLNGFIKKTQKTPPDIIAEAKKFKNEYLSRGECGND